MVPIIIELTRALTDLQSEFRQLRDERPKSYARQGKKIDGMCAFAEDSLDQCAHMPDALRDHDPKLAACSADSVNSVVEDLVILYLPSKPMR